MSNQPKRYFPGWSKLLRPQRGPFIHTKPDDIDHPDVLPRIGPDLLSFKSPPEPEARDKTVIVTAHGFAATPFENYFLVDWICQQSGQYLGSRVMLGGHGESTEAFAKARWRDWQAPLELELRRLHKLGYRNQVVFATSTGATLLLELLSRTHFPSIKKLVLVAPIIEPYDKLMRVATLARHSQLVPSLANTFTDEWIGCWYRELPLTAIEQLDRLTRKVRTLLRQGLKLPSDLQILIVQSRREVVVDRRSAFTIIDGLVQNHVELLFLDSHWHLPILPRPDDSREEALKQWVFSRIFDFLERKDIPPGR